MLNFKSFIIYTSDLRTNACALEDSLQRVLNGFSLPLWLHRHVAKGRQFDGDDSTDPSFLVHTFVTFARSDVVGLVHPTNGKTVVVVP